MTFIFSKTVLIAIIATVALVCCSTCPTRLDAFTPVVQVSVSQPNLRVQRILQPTQQSKSTTATAKTTTVLFAGSRRAIFQKTKKAVIGTVASIGLLKFLPTRVASAAATVTTDASSTVTLLDPTAVAQPTGRIIEFTVQNLDGEIGKNGVVKIQLEPTWSPKGVKRFEELCNIGFWNDARFFRVIPGFIVQFGINGDPSIQSKWRSTNIGDDPVRVSNGRGTVVFATAGPNSRTTQIFINTRPGGNGSLDKQGFSPIGKVIDGMEYVDQLYAGYGEGAPSGKGPNQARIQLQGNTYLKESYPKLSFVESFK